MAYCKVLNHLILSCPPGLILAVLSQRLEQTGERGGRETLLACLAAMVGTLPQQLVQPQWEQLLPWMVAALQPLGASRPDLQPALLSSLQQALRDPHGVLLWYAHTRLVDSCVFLRQVPECRAIATHMAGQQGTNISGALCSLRRAGSKGSFGIDK